MRITGYIAAAVIGMTVLASCLEENDMAYPHVYAEVLSFGVEGQESVKIDAESRTVSVEISETADLSRLEVTDFTFTSAAKCDDLHAGDILDLTSPMKIVLKTYQEYEWTITATQPVDRYVRCAGQVGEAEISLFDRRVFLKVSDNEDIHAIEFTDMKLEREGCVITSYEKEKGQMEPFESFPIVMDCLNWAAVEVKYGNETYTWQIQVETVNVDLMLTSINAWAGHADVSAVFDGTGTPYMRYREVGAGAWNDAADVRTEGTDIFATLTGLLPETEYEIMVANGDVTAEETFFTEQALQVENSDFDDWYQDGKAWMPGIDATPEHHIWDSANPGSATFGIVPTTPTDDVAVVGEGKQAARLETKYAVIALAAGNIYTGDFGQIAGLDAKLTWGTPFSSRPLSLKGYYKYQPVTIDRVKPPYEAMKGQTDICQIQVFITDWDAPFTVNTSTGTFVDVENDQGIIAYGKLETSGSSDEYQSFTIPLEYRDLERKPKYIVISACASRYGDYFTGGVGSVLYVDEFELVYDGDVVKAPGVE